MKLGWVLVLGVVVLAILAILIGHFVHNSASATARASGPMCAGENTVRFMFELVPTKLSQNKPVKMVLWSLDSTPHYACGDAATDVVQKSCSEFQDAWRASTFAQSFKFNNLEECNEHQQKQQKQQKQNTHSVTDICPYLFTENAAVPFCKSPEAI